MNLGKPVKKRRYMLSALGKAALQKAARHHQPWLKSTGPRTALGKSSAKMNALRHGARSAEVLERMRITRMMCAILQRNRLRATAQLDMEIAAMLRTRWDAISRAERHTGSDAV